MHDALDDIFIPVWTTWRDKTGEVVAVVVVWADNILAIAKSKHWAHLWETALRATCHYFAVAIKDSKITVTEGSVEFNGVFWVAGQQRGVWWRHLDTNVQHWGKTIPQPKDSAVACAGWLGVVYWDWHMSGLPLGAIAEVVEASRWIAKCAEEAGSWETTVVLPEFERILRHWVSVVGAGGNLPRFRGVTSRQTLTALGASDATLMTGAGLGWDSQRKVALLFVEPFVGDALARHINWKETSTACRVAELLLPGLQDGTILFLGEDNTTACKAISSSLFPGNAALSDRLWAVQKKAWAKRCEIRAIHVPGVIQAADESSRGRPINEEKAEVCRRFLETAIGAGTWWRKRARPEQEGTIPV